MCGSLPLQSTTKQWPGTVECRNAKTQKRYLYVYNVQVHTHVHVWTVCNSARYMYVHENLTTHICIMYKKEKDSRLSLNIQYTQPYIYYACLHYCKYCTYAHVQQCIVHIHVLYSLTFKVSVLQSRFEANAELYAARKKFYQVC